MRKNPRFTTLVLAIGGFAVVAGSTPSQATIVFPANQTPFNATVGETLGTTHDVCAFTDSQHKQKNFFRANIDWGDGNVENDLQVIIKNGRNRFVVRAAHQYGACGIYNVTCSVRYDKGGVHDPLTGPSNNQAIVVNSVTPAPAI